MASQEKRITRATSRGATPTMDPTEPTLRSIAQEANDLSRGRPRDMALKLADL